ncbi:ACP S-malonyltransferase [Embleya hyalina]|uniref:[acyl-carrier-protein] S-malonyltransferase n=1 Tax=Embleya hyalina TaxID=516124 RepID=A0A401YM93_9ACTN|nr:ACP S-malonyltransferase [Embleya hyalina]GCD95726.1 ACP S-malonyltransferase [Embleya hyalina]
MTTTFGIAFPGQGGKAAVLAGALRTHRRHPLVARLLDTFDAADPGALDLADTAVNQPAMCAAGIAAVEAAFGPAARPAVTVGHSLGELTAAACAGFLDTRDAFDLALARGALCRAQNLRRPGAMVAVVGAGPADIEWLRRRVLAERGGLLEIAGLNSARQVVLSGDPAAVRETVRLAAELCLRAEPLPIAGGFHSPLMMDAVPDWRARLAAVRFRPGTARFVSAIDARAHTDPDEVRERLARGLVLPVRWHEALRTVRELGVPGLIDAGPGDTLLRLGRRDRTMPFVGVGEAAAGSTAPNPADRRERAGGLA